MLHYTEIPESSGWSEIPAPRRARPGAFGGDCLSFAPTPQAHFTGAWTFWSAEIFDAYLLDAMLGVMSGARADHTRDLLAQDARIAGRLAPGTVEPLRRAGHAMLGRMDGMRGSRSALKFRTAAGRGETPGLFPIVFALQSAIYNVPARAALLAYARLEWRAARESQEGPGNKAAEMDASVILSRIDARFPPPIVPSAAATAVR